MRLQQSELGESIGFLPNFQSFQCLFPRTVFSLLSRSNKKREFQTRKTLISEDTYLIAATVTVEASTICYAEIALGREFLHGHFR